MTQDPTRNNGLYSLEPEVTFLPKPPQIDGVLDAELKNLPIRTFNYVEKSNDRNPLAEVNYRLAYGTEFFYLYVEVKADSFICRDRGYQNGDGFHMVLSVPRPGNVPTDEFFVMAFCPQKEPGRAWQKKFIWYRNIDLSFQPLKNTLFEVKESNGKVGYELLLPWKEVYPYHPWLLDSIGFNLCYVQAVEENEKNYFFVVKDNRIQSEQSYRLYTRLNFSAPKLSGGTKTYLILDQNHCNEGETIKARIAGISAIPTKDKIVVQINRGNGDVVSNDVFSFDIAGELTEKSFELKTSHLIPGEYQVKWTSQLSGLSGNISFTMLQKDTVTEMSKQLESIKDKISSGSLTTLEFKLQEIKTMTEKLKPYDTAEGLRISISKFKSTVECAAKGVDVIATKTGIQRRAYRSKIDNTLQPYSVKIPKSIAPGKKYPLLVFLHGSGMDDRQVLTEKEADPLINFIEFAPFGRGTSNAFSTDHAQDDIREAIDDVIAHYPVDTDRIILAGFSMGGYGVYRTFYENPKIFRALAVFSGHPDLANKCGIPGKHPNFLDERYLKPFEGVQIFIFHGGHDKNCPVDLTKKLVEMLKKAGAQVEFYLEEGKGHEMPGEEIYRSYLRWLKDVTK